MKLLALALIAALAIPAFAAIPRTKSADRILTTILIAPVYVCAVKADAIHAAMVTQGWA